MCTLSLTPCRSPAPYSRAATTLAPTAMPLKKPTSRLISCAVEPTEASDVSLANRPTTIMSAALYMICSTLVMTTGMAKTIILDKSGPEHMSIS